MIETPLLYDEILRLHISQVANVAMLTILAKQLLLYILFQHLPEIVSAQRSNFFFGDALVKPVIPVIAEEFP